MKKFEIFQLNDTQLSGLKGGTLIGGTTATNVATGYTQETKNDKDSNAANESSSASTSLGS
jgi:hypothetical protein